MDSFILRVLLSVLMVISMPAILTTEYKRIFDKDFALKNEDLVMTDIIWRQPFDKSQNALHTLPSNNEIQMPIYANYQPRPIDKVVRTTVWQKYVDLEETQSKKSRRVRRIAKIAIINQSKKRKNDNDSAIEDDNNVDNKKFLKK